MLAFVTAAHYNATSWDDFDMMNYFPENMKNQFNETILKFLMKGQCSASPNVAHQYYNLKATGVWPAIEYGSTDLDNYSCLNGWGFGNIAASG